LNQAHRQSAGGRGGEDAEEGAAGRDPGERALEDSRRDAPGLEVADGERGERAVRTEVGAEQDGRGIEPGFVEGLPQQRGRQVDDRDRVAYQRRRRPYRLECRFVGGDGEVARLPARGGAQVRQVSREPLLEVARAGGGDERRPRRAAAGIDQ
jgi:hypothetical protein